MSAVPSPLPPDKATLLSMISLHVQQQRRRCAFGRALLLSPNTSAEAKSQACQEALELMERLRHLGTLLVNLGDVEGIGRSLLESTESAIAQLAA